MTNNSFNPAPHPGITQTTPFTAVELSDIRRFCGYPAYAAFGYVYGAGGMANLDIQLANMSDQEQAVVRTTYLPNLATLELAVLNSGQFLNVDTAAVFKRNKNEVGDRTALFDQTRRRLCGFIGIGPGPDLMGRSRVLRG